MNSQPVNLCQRSSRILHILPTAQAIKRLIIVLVSLSKGRDTSSKRSALLLSLRL